MQLVTFSPISFVRVCVHVCARPFESLIDEPHENGLR